MSDENIVVTIDASTGEVTQRPLTNEEYAILASNNQALIDEELVIKQKQNVIQSAKDKLSNLGLTEEEINSLISGGI